MKHKFSEQKHSMKMVYGCAGVVVAAGMLAFATNAFALLFVVPCVLMMGAMVWMMMGGIGGRDRN